MSETTPGRHLARPPRRRSPGRSIALVALVMVVTLTGGFGAYLLVNRPSDDAGCGSGRVALQVVADPDQASILQQVASDYASTRPVVGDRCVDVNVRGVDSPEATATLASGWTDPNAGPRPDVWVPASSTWASELEIQLQGARRPALIPGERPSVATSPLVIAMPRPMAEVLGWPRRALGWSDLLGAMRNPEGWGAFGHPDWGQFKLGKTDPKLSEAGLSALLGATVATAAGPAGTLSPAQLASKAPELATLILEVARSAGDETDTASTLLANLQRADQAGDALGYVSAVALPEKSVWDYNQGKPIDDPSLAESRGRPKVPLVAVYPKEGTPQSDYPWIVLRAPWVDDAKRNAASDFLLYLKSPSVQAKFQAAGFRSARGQPGKLATVANGLLADQPRRILPSPPAQILGLVLKSWDQTKRIANLLAVFDVSGSMKDAIPGTGATKIELARRAAVSALRLFTTESDVGAWEFSVGLDGPRDYRQVVAPGPTGGQMPGGKTRLQVLQEALSRMQATNGDTGLYDTTLAAYEYVRRHYVSDRLNLVVLLTDGRNEKQGGLNLQQLLQRLAQGQTDDRKVRIITFAYGRDADADALRKISEATGGAFFASPNPADIERVFVTALANF